MRVATWIPETFPHFMCIGAPRAATTWLHTELSSDPRIFLPKRKELHFFDEKPASLLKRDSSGLRWRRNYYFDVENPAHKRWYWFQYRYAGALLRGDITPLYSLLSRNRVELIRSQMPDLKVFYILRNPIDRAWSGVRKTIWYQKGEAELAKADEKWLHETVMRPEVLARGDYRRAIETWESVYPREQICYLFYDDISDDSSAVLGRVFAFLGLDQLPRQIPRNSRKVNAAPRKPMPALIRGRLEDYYFEQIRYLEDRFKRDFSHWLSK